MVRSGQPEMSTKRGAVVVGAENTAALQLRHDVIEYRPGLILSAAVALAALLIAATPSRSKKEAAADLQAA